VVLGIGEIYSEVVFVALDRAYSETCMPIPLGGFAIGGR
jgi:hypothetical protein